MPVYCGLLNACQIASARSMYRAKTRQNCCAPSCLNILHKPVNHCHCNFQVAILKL